MKKTKRIIWGLVLVALGVLFGLNELNILPFELFFKGWWTLFIIVPSLVGLFTERDKLGNLIGLLFGVFFLLCAWDILSYSLLWELALPVVIVIVGLKLIFSSKKPQAEGTAPTDTPVGTPRGVAVFSGQELRFSGQVFHGAEAIAVFGGVELYAGDALIQSDCTIRTTAVFGGVDIHLPPTVNVKVISSGLFGGVEEKHAHAPIEGAPTVYVYATAVFGGVDIH